MNIYIKAANKNGTVRVQAGVYLSTQAAIIEAQKYWSDDDESKSRDFTTHAYWITTDGGQDAIGVDSEEDLQDALN